LHCFAFRDISVCAKNYICVRHTDATSVFSDFAINRTKRTFLILTAIAANANDSW
jgi:hypothetical protein